MRLSLEGASAGEPFRVQTFKTHSRITIQVDDTVPVELKNGSQGFELFLKGVSLSDLGAPLGDEQAWIDQYRHQREPRLENINFHETLEGVKVTGKWKFPSGKLALAHPVMETFDFRGKSPAEYQFDFWVKNGPTQIEVENDQRQAELAALVKKNQEEQKKRINRRIASEKKHAEAENSRQFCEKPLSEKTDVFLEFYPIHQNVDFSRWFPNTTADQYFSYYKPKKKTKDAQYVRVALQFYDQGKLGLAVRTLDFFDSEHPHSDFRYEMKFLRANALIKLGFPQKGEVILKQLMTDAKDSNVGLHSATYLAGKLMEKNQPLPALETFLWLIQHNSDNKLIWVFHLGAAECLYAMKQTERAAKEYQWVIHHGPDSESKAEAAFRLGDIYLSRFQYEQALASYFQGNQSFQDQSKDFPTFFLNRGETLYQLGQINQAKSIFEEFLQKFPNHNSGWRATFRIGEIVGRNPKSSLNDPESRGWFYQTINRYPFSPGATLARLRLLPCGDHGGFDYQGQERFFEEEASRYDGNGDVMMKNYPDLKALSQVRAVIDLGTQKQTTEVAIQGLKDAKSSVVRKNLTLIANNFFQKIVLGLLNEGKKYEALSLYQAQAHLLPKTEDTLDYEFLLKLSQAACDLGLGSLGKELAETYEESVYPKKSPAQRVIASNSNSDAEESSDLTTQLRESEKNFSQGKSIWLANRGKDPKESQKIRELLSNVKEESHFMYEKELILGLLDESEKKLSSALVHASRAQLFHSNLRMVYWVASLQAKTGDSKIALKLYRELENSILFKQKENKNISEKEDVVENLLGVPRLPSLDALILAQAEIFEKDGKWGESASTYARAVEKGWGGNQFRFEQARNLMKLGGQNQKEEAFQLLEKLVADSEKAGKDDFWKKLAQETLANEKSRQSVQKNAKEGIK
jgi:predicted negative regulator of RcsB-dependent stress response